jgi:hypothetical protein
LLLFRGKTSVDGQNKTSMQNFTFESVVRGHWNKIAATSVDRQRFAKGDLLSNY